MRYSMSIPLLVSFKHYGPHIMVDGSILSEEALHQDWAGDGTQVTLEVARDIGYEPTPRPRGILRSLLSRSSRRSR